MQNFKLQIHQIFLKDISKATTFVPFLIVLFLTVFSSREIRCQEVVNYIEFTANEIKSKEPVKTVLSVSDNVSKIIFAKRRNDALKKGYLMYNVDSIRQSGDTLYAIENYGHQYVFEKFDIDLKTENASVKDALLKKINAEQLADKTIANINHEILQWCENNGYPFANLSIESIEGAINDKPLSLHLELGTLYNIDSLSIRSEQKIKSRIIYNRIGIKKGEVYSESKIRSISKKIKDISYLNLIRDPEVLFTSEEAILYLFLKKKSTNNINGILGFSPDEDGNVELNGSFELKLVNAFGWDEFLDFKWRKLAGNSQNLDLDFAYPYLFNLDVGFTQSLNIFKQDTSFTEVRSMSGLQYLFDRNNYLNFYVKSAIHNSLLNEFDVGNNPESRLRQFGVGVVRSDLDYLFNPRKGYNFEITIGAGDKDLSGVSSLVANENTTISTRQITVDADASFYIPLKLRSVIKTNITSGYVDNENIILNEMYRIGGIKSLRGFDEGIFRASSYGIGTIEYRYLTDVNSYFNVFFDYGYLERRSIQLPATEHAEAFGVGLGSAFETGAGIFTISYALGKVDDNPFLLRTGKVHFGFNAVF